MYVAIILGLFFFFFTYYVTPYLALIPELSRTHKDRIFLTVIQAVFSLAGAAVIMMAVPVFWESMKKGGMAPGLSLGITLSVMAFIGFVSMLTAALPINESKFIKSEPANVRLMESIKMTLSNKTFIIYMISTILFWFSFHIIISIIAYYPMVLLDKEQSFQTILMVVLFGSALVCFIAISLISKWISNKTLMLFGLLSFSIFMALTYFIEYTGDFKVTAGLIHMVLLGIPVSILLVIPNAVVSDISEADGYTTGKKREAMFFGTQGLFMKINYGIAAAVVTFLFAVFGQDVSNPMGVKLSGPVAGVFSLAGFFLFLFFPGNKINEILMNNRSEN